MLLAVVLLMSCEATVLDGIDYRFEPIVSKSDSPLTTNSTTRIALDIKAEYAKGEPIKIKLANKSNYKGVITVDGKVFDYTSEIEHVFSSPLYFEYTPNMAGDHKISLSLVSSRVLQDVDFEFVATEPQFKMNISDYRDSINIYSPHRMGVVIGESVAKLNAMNNGRKSSYTVKGNIKKGTGIIRLNNTTLFDNSEVKALSDKNVTVEENQDSQLEYKSCSLGKSAIILEVSDEHGNTIKEELEFNSHPSTTKFVDKIISTELLINTPILFTLKLDNPTLTDAYKEFYIKSDLGGTLNVNDKDYTWNTNISGMKNDTYNFVFTPSKADKNTIEFIAVDEYENESKYAIEINVSSYPLNVSVDNVSKLSADRLEAITFDISFSEIESGDMQIKYINTKGEGTLISDYPFVADEYRTLPQGTHTLTYIPLTPQANVIDIVVMDENGQSITRSLAFTIKAIPTQFELPEKLTTFKDQDLEIPFSINQKGYTDDFSISASSSVYYEKAFLYYKDVELLGDKAISASVSSGSHSLTFKSSAVGEGSHYITVKGVDIFGAEVSKTIEVEVKTNPLQGSVSSTQTNKYIHRIYPITFDISGGKAPYTIKYLGDGSNGTLSSSSDQKSNIIGVNGTFENRLIYYSNTSAGNRNLSFEITSDDNQKIEVSTALNIQDYDITAELTTTSSNGIISSGFLSRINMSTPIANEKLNVKFIVNGGTLNRTSGDYEAKPLDIVFTADNVAGSKSVQAIVKDDFGKTKTLNWQINTSYAPVKINITPTTCYVGIPNKVSYQVTKEKYSGSFNVNMRTLDGGIINPATAVVGNTAKTFEFTPRTINDNSLIITTTDAQEGNIKTHPTQRLNVVYPTLSTNARETQSDKNLIVGKIMVSTNNYPANTKFNFKVLGGTNSTTTISNVTNTSCEVRVMRKSGGGIEVPGVTLPMNGTIEVMDIHGQKKQIQFQYKP